MIKHTRRIKRNISVVVIIWHVCFLWEVPELVAGLSVIFLHLLLYLASVFPDCFLGACRKIENSRQCANGVRERKMGLTDQNRMGAPIVAEEFSAICREIPREIWLGRQDFPGNSPADFPYGNPNSPGNSDGNADGGRRRPGNLRGNSPAGQPKFPGAFSGEFDGFHYPWGLTSGIP